MAANFFEVWGKESPETMKAFMDFAGALQTNSGLDAKTFQLVYLALQASRGAVGSHRLCQEGRCHPRGG